MKRAIRKFVSHLNGRNKYLFFMALILICIVALSLSIYVQFFYKYSDTDPFMIGINIGAKKTAEEYDLLKSSFNELFQNNVKINSKELRVRKLENNEEIVYTAYNLVNQDETFYSVDAQIPILNIDSEIAKKINQEIKNEYYNKANSIMRQNEGNTIYKVSYKAYVNSDVLSLVIKASLKEEGKSERVFIQTYNYSFSKEELISLKDLIELKKTTIESVQNSIQTEIKKAYDNAKIIAVEYGNLYERDLSNEMYQVEKTPNYFLTDDGYVYLVYDYGNNDYTKEKDILIF